MSKFPDPFALSWGPWPPVAVEASHARRTLAFRMREIELRRAVAGAFAKRATELVQLVSYIEAGCDRDLVQVLADAERLGVEPATAFQDKAERLAQFERAIRSGLRLAPADYIERCARVAVDAIAKSREIDCISAPGSRSDPPDEWEKFVHPPEGKSTPGDIGASEGGVKPEPSCSAPDLGSRSCARHNSTEARSGSGAGFARDQSGNNSTPGCTGAGK